MKNKRKQEAIMSQDYRNHRQAAYDKDIRNSERNNSEYIYGNTVRKLEPQRRPEEKEAPVRKQHPEVRKNREKAHYMNAGYVLFLTVAVCVAAFVLMNYIQLQSKLTALTKMVAGKESELSSLRQLNDEEYNRIINSIDLEEIRRIAMGELGMVYVQEGQIIIYESENNDYMRQVIGNNQ